jgi:predicted nucleic acid-binding protein
MKSGIMSAERILIDTSVWIEYFRNQSPVFVGFVAEVVKTSEIYVPKIILAELMQGAKSEKELAVIAEFMGAFSIIDQTDQTWIKAGRLSHELRRKGKNINLTDCYIAVIAQENDCAIFTLDRHFKEIRQYAGIQLVDAEASVRKIEAVPKVS